MIRISMLIITLVLLFSCQQNDTILNVKEPMLSEESLENLIVVQGLGGDSLMLQNRENSLISSQQIIKIEISYGHNAPGQFWANDTIVPLYIEQDEGYLIEFNSVQKIPDRSEVYISYTCRFYFSDQSIKDIHLHILGPSYPYPSVELYYLADEISEENWLHVQGFARNATDLFFTNTGPTCLYRHNFLNRQTQPLYHYGSGGYVALTENYVFIDGGGCCISRYNLEKDSLDLHFDLSNIEYININGLAGGIENDLYVLFQSSETSQFIARFNFDGDLLETYDYPRQTFWLAINNHLVYSYEYSDSYNIAVYDLNTETFLSSLIPPTQDTEGIFIYQDRFYFAEFYRRAIFSMPLTNLKIK